MGIRIFWGYPNRQKHLLLEPIGLDENVERLNFQEKVDIMREERIQCLVQTEVTMKLRANTRDTTEAHCFSLILSIFHVDRLSMEEEKQGAAGFQ